MIDDPVNGEVVIQRTKRVIDKDVNRWKPGESAGNTAWGLIVVPGKDNNNPHLAGLDLGGLGPLPEGTTYKSGERIGYIHGMTSAINKGINARPWCTPYELATVKETTKMASCFACTTYMYATGFPPSSTHLGRGESWIPPKPGLVSGESIETTMPAFFKDNISKPLIERWHWDIYHYLCLGSKDLTNAIKLSVEETKMLKAAGLNQEAIDYVNSTHKDSVTELVTALNGVDKAKINELGGNLFLDALTAHDSDWKRIMRTLQPVYDN